MSVIAEYILTAPADRQEKLTQLYTLIKKIAPQSTEKIAYGMPTFYLNGNLVHFANMKNHIGFYPAPAAIETFKEELAGFKTSKGAIQFPLDKELPLELIKKIVLFRLAENTPE